MATKLTAFLFTSSAVIVVITTAIVFVPNLISYTVSVSMTDIMELQSKMGAIAAMGRPQNGQTVVQQHSTTTPLPNDNRDFRLSVSLGIWRCAIETKLPTIPIPVTWGGSYISLGDKFETTANQMTPMLNQMGPVKMLLGDDAFPAIAGLIRTMFIRVEIEVTVALLFSIIALAMTFANMCWNEGQTKPLVIICAAMCHVIVAILLGVALGAFAQQLQQVTSMADIYSLLKITEKGYGILVLGFLVVLVAIVLAVIHLLMLAIKGPYQRFGQGDDPLAYPATGKFTLKGEYDV